MHSTRLGPDSKFRFSEVLMAMFDSPVAQVHSDLLSARVAHQQSRKAFAASLDHPLPPAVVSPYSVSASHHPTSSNSLREGLFGPCPKPQHRLKTAGLACVT
ncbi:hypothetical protein V6Z92_010014 [Aspergillus fumigatus]